MKVLIVEDEPLAAERLAELILQYESHIDIVASLDSISSTVEWIQKNKKPDLAFFDIQLADGLSFRIFEQVDFDVPVIFTTAFDAYTLQAFKVNSVDYLLKPIQFDDLAEAIDKYVKLFGKNMYASTPLTMETISELIQSVKQQTSPPHKKRYVVRRGEQLVSVPVEEILYFYAEDKLTFFRTHENKRYTIEYTLSDLEQQLPTEDFFRINRQYIVSHRAIERIIAHSHSRLKLTLLFANDPHVVISKQKVLDFKRWLGN